MIEECRRARRLGVRQGQARRPSVHTGRHQRVLVLVYQSEIRLINVYEPEGCTHRASSDVQAVREVGKWADWERLAGGVRTSGTWIVQFGVQVSTGHSSELRVRRHAVCRPPLFNFHVRSRNCDRRSHDCGHSNQTQRRCSIASPQTYSKLISILIRPLLNKMVYQYVRVSLQQE